VNTKLAFPKIEKGQQYKTGLFTLIFLLFLLLRLFSSTPYFFIQAGDDARFLALAQSFPNHLLYNHQFYLVHPPIFPWVIALFSFFAEDYIAGILVSLLSASVSFFLIYIIFSKVTSNDFVAFTVLLFYSLSPAFINLSTTISKESFSLMIFLLCIYYYISFIENRNRNFGIASAGFGFLSAFTTDHTLLLLPALTATAFFLSKTRIRIKHFLPIIAIAFFYLSWIGVRAYIYTYNEFYPAAFDGTPVFMQGWGIRELLSPQYFVEEYVPFGTSYDVSHYLYPLFYMTNIIFAPWPPGLNFHNFLILFSGKYLFQAFFYPIVLGLGMAGFTYLLRVRNWGEKRNPLLWMISLFAIYFVPASQVTTSTRYIITANLFFYAAIGIGLVQLFEFLKLKRKLRLVYSLMVLLSFVLLIPHLAEYHHFIFHQKKIVELEKTATFVNSLPKDGFMIQYGYPDELIYLTGKRVVSLPEKIEDFEFVDLLNINYVMYGEYYSQPYEAGQYTMFSYWVIDYIRKHPLQFKLIKVIEETYPTKERSDHIYIYEVTKT